MFSAANSRHKCVNGLITRIPGKNCCRLTDDGLRFAIFYTKLHDLLLRPFVVADKPPAPPPLRKAFRTINIHTTEPSTRPDSYRTQPETQDNPQCHRDRRAVRRCGQGLAGRREAVWDGRPG